jgi:glyoxylase-like metal-dependent hydrolase (beta-lactamase superfamily II)
MTPPVTIVPTPHLDPRIRVLRCGTIVDAFALLTERYRVIIDTMVSEETMENGLAQLEAGGFSGRPLLVMNTHGDWDHVCGNGIFCGPRATQPAPVIGTRFSAERMTSRDAIDYLERLKERFPGEFDTATLCPPTVRYEESLMVDCGDLTLETVPTPGHQPDHVAIWCPQLRLLMAGDAAESPMPLVDEPASVPVLRESLRRMHDLDPVTVLYCHAPEVTDVSVIRNNIQYFDGLEERCRSFLNGEGSAGAGADDEGGLNWPLEEALPPGVEMEDLAEPEPNFYRNAHNRAIRAMLGWLDLPQTHINEE